MAKRSTKKKQTLPVLFNYTNRPYSAWSEAEKAAAKAAYHEVVDIKVEGNAPTDASIDDLQELISAQFSAIFQPASEEYEKSSIAPLACITGEPTLIFSLVNHLEGAGMRCLAPIWKTNEKGEQEFSLFRLYSSDSNWNTEEDEEGNSEEGEDDENALQQALAQLSQMLSGEGGETLAQELLQSAFPNGTDEEGGKVFNLADYIDSGDDYEEEDEEEAEGESAKPSAEKPKKDKKDKKEGKEKKEKKEEKEKKKKKK